MSSSMNSSSINDGVGGCGVFIWFDPSEGSNVVVPYQSVKDELIELKKEMGKVTGQIIKFNHNVEAGALAAGVLAAGALAARALLVEALLAGALRAGGLVVGALRVVGHLYLEASYS
ncbi:hypothetical protein ACFE04_019956 [Oxalis oulophora]